MASRNTALLFPGQASQYVGMGLELRAANAGADYVLRTAERVTGLQLGKLFTHGPLDQLTDTRVAQPAVVATSLMAWEALSATFEAPSLESRIGWCAGHSVGEYAALVVAGALRAEDALALVHERARLMAEACQAVDGTMVAVMGLDEAALVDVCDRASATTGHLVQIANLNAPEQVVLSGERRAVEEAMRLASKAGAKRCLPLNVAGPFHSEYMRPAAEAFAPVVARVELRAPRFPIVLNQTARPTRDPLEIRRELVEQIRSPVRWVDSMQQVAALGASYFVELGPGKVLAGLARRTVDGAIVLNVQDNASLAETVEGLSQQRHAMRTPTIEGGRQATWTSATGSLS